MTKERYNELFKQMILTGYACGVSKPHEIICNFDNLFFFDSMNEMESFLNKAIVNIYSAIYGVDLTFKEANEHYGQALNGEKK